MVIQHHIEVRDAIGDLASLIWNHVRCEPIVREGDSETGTPALVSYLAVRSVWIPQTEALFEIRVTDTDTQSYSNQSPQEVLQSAENEKKKYLGTCEERRGQFTPIWCLVDGMYANEAEVFLTRVVERLMIKWERIYCEVMGWIRTRMSFAILRSSILCLRGSRTK